MIYRLLLLGFLIYLASSSLSGQRYFSKLKKFDQGTQSFSNIEVLDSNLFWLQSLKFLPGSKRMSGYYYLDGQGNFIDSFFHKNKSLLVKTIPANNYIFKDDLIYQVYSYRDTYTDHDIYVSSISQRDSVDFFPIDFQRPEWDRVFLSTMTWYEDHIYMFGVGYISGEPREHDIFMIKMDFDGNMIWLKDIDHYQFFEVYHDINSNVLEKEGFFYFTNTGNLRGFNRDSRVYKVSKDGELIWRSDLEDQVVDVDASTPDITFTTDSSAVVWMNNRVLRLEDVDNDWEVYQNSSFNPISLTLLDTADGSFIKDYLHIKDSIYNKFAILNVITSRFNGDYIFAGIWENLQGDFNQPMNPLIGRVNPSGEFKWVRLVADRWGDEFTAESFTSVEEAHNGDLVLIGNLRRQASTDPEPAWVMRIGPEGCVPGYTYCTEDTLIINHPNIMVTSAIPQLQRQKLEVYPNPLSSGQTVYLGFPEEGFPLRGVAQVRWVSSEGRTMAEQQLDLIERPGYRTSVPPNLPPGMYFVEMRVGGEQYVARVVVE